MWVMITMNSFLHASQASGVIDFLGYKERYWGILSDYRKKFYNFLLSDFVSPCYSYNFKLRSKYDNGVRAKKRYEAERPFYGLFISRCF